MSKKQNIFDVTLKIEVLKEEIEYAKSCFSTSAYTASTAISWMTTRLEQLEKEEHL